MNCLHRDNKVGKSMRMPCGPVMYNETLHVSQRTVCSHHNLLYMLVVYQFTYLIRPEKTSVIYT